MATDDHADVLGRPPLLYAGSLAISLLLQKVWPADIVDGASLVWTCIVLPLPVGLIVWGRRALLRAGTAVNPALATSAIVSSGPFRFSRNPLYIGLTLIYLILTMIANSWWGMLLLCPLGLLMHFGVVRREEQYLERKFGNTYRRYRSTVPRY